MKRLRAILLLSSAAAMLPSCGDDMVAPAFESALPPHTAPLNEIAKERMEGVYAVCAGSGRIGDQAVVRWSGAYLDIFCGTENGIFVLTGGVGDTALDFSGRLFFRDSPEVLSCRLSVGAGEGMASILAAGADSQAVILRGWAGDPASPANAVVLERVRPLAPPHPFLIVAHKGGFLNGGAFSDAENSIGVARNAGMFGIGAIEVDARLTKEGVPILFHDDNFTKARIRSEYLTGPVNGFTYSHIRAFGTLINGERIPSVAEFLAFVIDSTAIAFVELDVKTPETIDRIIPLQREALDRARAALREIEILIDLGSAEVADAFLRNPDHASAPCMCELGVEETRRTGARIWSPRWTLGPMDADIARMHAEGRRILPWTVNEPQYMDILLQRTETDGVLTDYPNMAIYQYHVSH